MAISERQKEILNGIVAEYIRSAEPVSSKLLEKKYRLKVCPATVRNEMQKLTEDGFIYQPHTSAGRVPTDKGYRFFVDNLLEKEFFGGNLNFEIKEWLEKEMNEMKDSIRILQLVTKNLASVSSNLALGYLPDLKILWKDGWEEIIKEPEFEEKSIVSDFIGMLESFEREIGDLEINSHIKVYIGKENPFSRAKEFSTILTRCRFPVKKGEGVLAIMGPKRMDYNKNIGLMDYLTKLLEEI